MFGLWWQALPRERASGLGTLAGSRNSSHQLRGGERGEQELCFTGGGKGSCHEDTQRRGVRVR